MAKHGEKKSGGSHETHMLKHHGAGPHKIHHSGKGGGKFLTSPGPMIKK